MISQATLTTEKSSRYLQQLCKHFGHKVPVEFTPEKGRIELPFGTCQLEADAAELRMTLDTTEAEMDRMERVIGDHLERFAFRETPVLTWHRAS